MSGDGGGRAVLTPQQKQRKRERKRLEREERRKSLRTSLAADVELGGDVSETLLEFAGPLIEGLRAHDDGDEELTARLRFAAVVWNAVIEAEGDALEAFTELVLDMRAKVRAPTPVAAIAVLAKRKADDFGDDLRTILAVDVHRRAGRLRITARSAVLASPSPPSWN